jgi:hypothetical protein
MASWHPTQTNRTHSTYSEKLEFFAVGAFNRNIELFCVSGFCSTWHIQDEVNPISHMRHLWAFWRSYRHSEKLEFFAVREKCQFEGLVSPLIQPRHPDNQFRYTAMLESHLHGILSF